MYSLFIDWYFGKNSEEHGFLLSGLLKYTMILTDC